MKALFRRGRIPSANAISTGSTNATVALSKSQHATLILRLLSRSEAMAILAGDDESFDHLGVNKVPVEFVQLA